MDTNYDTLQLQCQNIFQKNLLIKCDHLPQKATVHPKLFLAIITTQMIATVITAQGILVPAIEWYHALFVWAYARNGFW